MSVARWDGRMRMVPVLTARMVVAMSYSCRWEGVRWRGCQVALIVLLSALLLVR
jgi:hypothetical protein